MWTTRQPLIHHLARQPPPKARRLPAHGNDSSSSPSLDPFHLPLKPKPKNSLAFTLVPLPPAPASSQRGRLPSGQPGPSALHHAGLPPRPTPRCWVPTPPARCYGAAPRWHLFRRNSAPPICIHRSGNLQGLELFQNTLTGNFLKGRSSNSDKPALIFSAEQRETG